MKKTPGSSKRDNQLQCVQPLMRRQNIFNYREKKLLSSGDNFGRDLPSVQNLQKKQQHFETELESHSDKVASLKSRGKELQILVSSAASQIEERCARLEELWQDLNKASQMR